MRQSFRARFLGDPRVQFSLLWLAVVVLCAAFAQVLAPLDPFAITGKPFTPPFHGSVFGTDALGRDILAGLIYGSRATLLVALIATACALLIGTTVGALAGFHEGMVGNVLMRVTELFQTVPTFVFAIVLVALLSPSLASLSFSIAVVSWPPIARIVRAEVLTLKTRDYISAARTLGRSNSGILWKEILPNILSPLIVTGSLLIATAILIESALAFLGLGAPNVMSWGFMVGAGRSFMRDAWWVVTIPGIAILLTVLSINLIGEGLNDALNPRLEA